MAATVSMDTFHLQQACQLTAPQPKLTSGGDAEGADFWDANDELLKKVIEKRLITCTK